MSAQSSRNDDMAFNEHKLEALAAIRDQEQQEDGISGQSAKIVMDCEDITDVTIPVVYFGGVGMSRSQSYQSFSMLQGTGHKRMKPIYVTMRKENGSIEAIQYGATGMYISEVKFTEFTYHNGNQTVFFTWTFKNCMITRYEFIAESRYLLFQINYDEYEFVRTRYDPKSGDQKGQEAVKGSINDDKDA